MTEDALRRTARGINIYHCINTSPLTLPKCLALQHTLLPIYLCRIVSPRVTDVDASSLMEPQEYNLQWIIEKCPSVCIICYGMWQTQV